MNLRRDSTRQTVATDGADPRSWRRCQAIVSKDALGRLTPIEDEAIMTSTATQAA
jgi:hypothetical protein